MHSSTGTAEVTKDLVTQCFTIEKRIPLNKTVGITEDTLGTWVLLGPTRQDNDKRCQDQIWDKLEGFRREPQPTWKRISDFKLRPPD